MYLNTPVIELFAMRVMFRLGPWTWSEASTGWLQTFCVSRNCGDCFNFCTTDVWPVWARGDLSTCYRGLNLDDEPYAIIIVRIINIATIRFTTAPIV